MSCNRSQTRPLSDRVRRSRSEASKWLSFPLVSFSFSFSLSRFLSIRLSSTPTKQLEAQNNKRGTVSHIDRIAEYKFCHQPYKNSSRTRFLTILVSARPLPLSLPSSYHSANLFNQAMNTTRRKQQQSNQPQSNRTPALLIAFSSLLLSSGLATSLFVFNQSIQDQLDGDLDQAAVVAWWTGNAALKWALISSVGSLCGCIGILTVSI